MPRFRATPAPYSDPFGRDSARIERRRGRPMLGQNGLRVSSNMPSDPGFVTLTSTVGGTTVVIRLTSHDANVMAFRILQTSEDENVRG